MDYEKHVNEMIMHLDNNHSIEEFSKFVTALGSAISTVFASYIPNHEAMHLALDQLDTAIQLEACERHAQIHDEHHQASHDHHQAPEVLQ